MFGRPIGKNQGVAVPDRARLYQRRSREPDALQGVRAVRRAQAMRRRSEHGEAPGRGRFVGGGQRRACRFHGGFGFAAEYDVERKFRETRLYQVAPISTNLILSYVAEHVLGLPRSFLDHRRQRPSHRMLPLSRHPRHHPGARDRGAVLYAPACRSGRARDQDRAARRRRLRARLRRARARAGVALRLDQPQQGKPDARRQASGSGSDPCRAHVARRRAGAEPRARRRGAARPVARGAVRAQPTPDRLRHLGLRRPTDRTATRRRTTC